VYRPIADAHPSHSCVRLCLHLARNSLRRCSAGAILPWAHPYEPYPPLCPPRTYPHTYARVKHRLTWALAPHLGYRTVPASTPTTSGGTAQNSQSSSNDLCAPRLRPLAPSWNAHSHAQPRAQSRAGERRVERGRAGEHASREKRVCGTQRTYPAVMGVDCIDRVLGVSSPANEGEGSRRLCFRSLQTDSPVGSSDASSPSE
jgi:hypothetical protein